MPMISEATPIAFADALPDATDVVVIGGGMAGMATAWFLARAGVSVLVCEKGRVAGEQSSRNWGWIRQQGRDWAELPIMIESNRIWQGLAAETGEADLGFQQKGCLYLAETPAAMTKYETWYDMAQQHQLGTRLLSKADIARELPGVEGTWLGGMITPSDGRGEPFVAVPALARATRAAGARIAEGCAVRALDIAGGRVAGVVTEMGRVRCDRVLLAAGAWSGTFAGNAGFDLPQLSVRSTAGRTEAAPDLFAPNISTPGITLRRRTDGGYTVASGDLSEHYLGPSSFRHLTKFFKLLKLSARDVAVKLSAPGPWPGTFGVPRRWAADETSPFEKVRVLNPPPSDEVVRRMRERLPKRFPALAGVKLAEAWAGMIDVTPDAVPYLGPADGVPGLYLATGMSGHGFGIGPGLGRVMADVLRGRDPGHDLRRFRHGRFADGSPIVPGPY